MKPSLYLFCIIILALLAAWFYYTISNHSGPIVPMVNTDTVYIPYAVHDTLKVRVYSINKKDTSSETGMKPMALPVECPGSVSLNKDEQAFLARADTAYHDSLLSLRLGFLSPSPIHPDSRFIIDIAYRKMQVIREISSRQSFSGHGKFHFSLNLGLGLGLIHGKADIYAGAGISCSF